MPHPRPGAMSQDVEESGAVGEEKERVEGAAWSGELETSRHG